MVAVTAEVSDRVGVDASVGGAVADSVGEAESVPLDARVVLPVAVGAPPVRDGSSDEDCDVVKEGVIELLGEPDDDVVIDAEREAANERLIVAVELVDSETRVVPLIVRPDAVNDDVAELVVERDIVGLRDARAVNESVRERKDVAEPDGHGEDDRETAGDDDTHADVVTEREARGDAENDGDPLNVCETDDDAHAEDGADAERETPIVRETGLDALAVPLAVERVDGVRETVEVSVGDGVPEIDLTLERETVDDVDGEPLDDRLGAPERDALAQSLEIAVIDHDVERVEVTETEPDVDGEPDSVRDTTAVPDSLTDIEKDGEREPVRDGPTDVEAVVAVDVEGVAELETVEVAFAETVRLTVADDEKELVREAALLDDAELQRDIVTSLLVSVMVGVAGFVPMPLVAADADVLIDGDSEDEGETLKDARGEVLPRALALLDLDAAGARDVVGDALVDGDTRGVAEMERDTAGVFETSGDGDEERETIAFVFEPADEADEVMVPALEGDDVLDDDVDRVFAKTVRDMVAEFVTVELADADGDFVARGETVIVSVDVKTDDSEADVLAEGESEADALDDSRADAEADGSSAVDTVLLALTETDGEAAIVGDTLRDRVPSGDADTDRVLLARADTVRVTDIVMQALVVRLLTSERE